MVSWHNRNIPDTIHEHKDDYDDEEVVSLPRSAASSSYLDPHSQATDRVHNQSTSPHCMSGYGYDDSLSYLTPTFDRARAFRSTDVSSMTGDIDELSTVAPSEPKQKTTTTPKTSSNRKTKQGQNTNTRSKKRNKSRNREHDPVVCCVCQPYNDFYMMTAQGLVIGAFCLSWVWWLVLLIATPPLIVLQCVWCCSMRKRGLIAAMALSVLSSHLMVIAGIYIILAWKDQTFCSVLLVWDQDDDDDNYGRYRNDSALDNDECTEIAWAVVAFIDALGFAGTAWCLYIFVYYRMDKILERHTQEKQEQQVQEVEDKKRATARSARGR